MKGFAANIVLDEKVCRDLLNQMQVGIFVLVDEQIKWANRAMLFMLDYTMDELASQSAWQIVHPQDRQQVRAIALERVAGIRMDEVYETRLVRHDGQTIWAEIRAVPIVFKGIPAILTNVLDITQRKKIKHSLEQSEERVRTFLQSAPVGIYRITPDGQVLMANPAMMRMLGFDEWSDPQAIDLQRQSFDPTFPECEFKARMEREGEVTGVESAWIRNDDSLLYVRENAKVVLGNSGKTRYYDGTVEDITRDKLANQTLALYASRLEVRSQLDQEILQAQSPEEIARVLVSKIRRLVPCFRASVVTIDTQSDSAKVLAEITSTEVSQELTTGFESPLGDLIPDEILANPSETFYEFDLKQRKEIAPSAMPLVSLGLRSYLMVPLLSQGRLIGTLNLGSEHPGAFDSEQRQIASGLAGQLTVALEQTHLRDKLATERARLKTLVDNLPEGVFLADSAFHLVLANPAALRYLEAIEGISVKIGMDLDDTKIGRRMSTGEFELVTNKEPSRVFQVISSRASAEQGQDVSTGDSGHVSGWAVILRDVTDERNRQVLLGRHERRATIGALAEGVAHDFNNLISAISGSAWIILRKLPRDSSLRSTAEDIKETCDRATRLTKQLVEFSRSGSEGKKILNLNSVVDGMGKMLVRLVGSPIQVSIDLSKDLVPVFTDPVGLEQVLVNLVINARDAMRMGGKLFIATSLYRVEQGEKSWSEQTPAGQYVMLKIKDSGDGMDEATMNRMFDPFFTTKLHSGGTGLGLSNVKTIVSKAGGRIRVQSEQGHGTTIEIIYPVAGPDFN